MLLNYSVDLITKEKKVTGENYQPKLVLMLQGGLNGVDGVTYFAIMRI